MMAKQKHTYGFNRLRNCTNKLLPYLEVILGHLETILRPSWAPVNLNAAKVLEQYIYSRLFVSFPVALVLVPLRPINDHAFRTNYVLKNLCIEKAVY